MPIFQLTNKRNSLMYHLKSMKKEGKISKLFSNENGQLGLKVSDTSEKKVLWLIRNMESQKLSILLKSRLL